MSTTTDTPTKTRRTRKAAAPPPPARGPKALTDEHKEALALGREQSRVVRRYLEALELHKPKRGRKRTPESIQNRLAVLDAALTDANALARLNILQEQANLIYELETMTGEEDVDMASLEEDFIGAAKAYAERKGVTYAVWREAGVDADVLKRAGITRAF